MKLLPSLTLGKKITLLTTLGLILGIGVLSFLGMRAVNQATEVMLQDRMTTARLVADYVNEALSSKNRPRGLGLLGMKERIELVNGTLDIRSRRGGGTEISIEIPLNGEGSNG